MNKDVCRKEYYDFFNNFEDPHDEHNWNNRNNYYAGLEMVYPLRIEMNGDTTTVFWDDGTKTTVVFSDSDKGMLKSAYSAFCAAFAKRMYRSNSQIHKMVEASDSKRMDQEFEDFLDEKEQEEEAKKAAAEKKKAKSEARKAKKQQQKKNSFAESDDAKDTNKRLAYYAALELLESVASLIDELV